jgi:DNA-binding ferritin-like protein
MMPKNLGAIQELSVTNDTEVTGNAITLLQAVYDDLETLIDLYKDLNTVAEEEDHSEIANYAQDQLRLLRKSCWMLRSIFEDEDADADYD